MAVVRLAEADLRAVVNTATAADQIPPAPGAISEILRATAALVRCDRIFWTRLDTSEGVRKLTEIGLPTEPWAAPWQDWLDHLPEHPIMSQRYDPVTAISDVYSWRDFQRTWLYNEAFRPAGIAHEIGVQLSHPVSEIHTFVISRTAGRDFSDRDHLVLQLLRPHLDAAIRRTTGGPPRLTARESSVMAYVRDGLSNHQIGRALGIAETTVAKHLANIFRKTGARSRVQAVARWDPPA